MKSNLKMYSLLCVGGILLVTNEAQSVTIRADRDDSLYTNLAALLMPQGGSVTGPGWLGSGTLISPTWVLTAGHVASGSATTFSSPAGTRSIINQYQFSGGDVGLVQLNSPITSYDPVKLYNVNAFGIEDGQDALIGGAGGTGTGLTGDARLDGVPRLAETRVYANASAWGWSADQLLTWFRPPAGGAANLEGGSAPGDSGGGLFLNVNGTWSIAGVLSLSWKTTQPYGAYDTGGVFMRTGTSPLLSWIKSYATDAQIVSSAPPTPVASRKTLADFEAPTFVAGSGWNGVGGWSGNAAFERVAPDSVSGYVFRIDGQSATLLGGTMQHDFSDAADQIAADGFEISVSMMRPEGGAASAGGWYVSDNLDSSRQAGIEFQTTDFGNQAVIWSGGAYHLVPIDLFSWVVGQSYETTLKLTLGADEQSFTAYLRDLTAGGALVDLGTYTFDGGMLYAGNFRTNGGIILSSPVGATVYDNIVVAVPEPVSMMLLVFAGPMLARRKQV